MLTLCVLLAYIGVKLFLYGYNTKKNREKNLQALKADAADCIYDAVSTSLVTVSLLTDTLFHIRLDGWCGLLEPSKLRHILTENAALRDYEAPEGTFIHYKGRAYCWRSISPEESMVLLPEMLSFLQLAIGTELLSIRSSDIAFTMGAKGHC